MESDDVAEVKLDLHRIGTRYQVLLEDCCPPLGSPLHARQKGYQAIRLVYIMLGPSYFIPACDRSRAPQRSACGRSFL